MNHVAVVDLGYGDAGKGTVVDRLCATRQGTDDRIRAVVRFNGGCQAAHNVVLPDGRQHTFAQFGAGTFHGVPTFLSRYMLVEPLSLRTEAQALAAMGVPSPLDVMIVDRDALVTTPYHKAANRARERLRGDDRHGSCGRGIGETMSAALAHPEDALTVGDLDAPLTLRRKLVAAHDRLRAEFDDAALTDPRTGRFEVPDMNDLMTVYMGFSDEVTVVPGAALVATLQKGPCVFEGAQGVLLDEDYGFHPYTTWSKTTFDNAEALLAEADMAGMADRLGVVRCFTTRHGAGPLVTEDRQLTADLQEPHNTHNAWQGGFRVGHFDAVAHRYAIAACRGVDGLVVTHLDRVPHNLVLYREYNYDWTDNNRGSHIDLLDPADFAARERLTDVLMTTAKPRYLSGVAPTGPDAWADAIQDALGPPVVMTSHGPTWHDKKERVVAHV